MDDDKIVDLFLKRDEEALSHAQQKYSFRLTKIAESILKDPETAEECVNDTFLSAWNLIPPNEPRTYLFAFLGKIARHIAIDRLRRDSALKRDVPVCELTQEIQECIPSSDNTEGPLDAEVLTDCINSFLSNCSETARNIFIRRYWFFDQIQDISKRYGFTQSKVKTTLHRTREDLRRYLNERGFDI